MLNLNDEEDAIKSLPKFDSVTSNTQYGNNKIAERINSSSCESYLDSTMATTFSSTSAMTTSNETNSFDSALPLTTDFNNHQLINDQSNLDFVDFIEVNNDLINIDQECAWLVDPKSAQNSKSYSKQFNLVKQNSKQEQIISDKKNLFERDDSDQFNTNGNKNNNHSNNSNSQNKSSKKNPYKWIMEEFEDKNLDKVKRTLLVALDDISKGFNRRSRSVSTSRTPYYHHHHQQQNIQNQNNHHFMYYQQQQQQEQQQHQDAMFNDFNELSLTKQQVNNFQTVPQSKSTESILNEDSVDSSLIDHLAEPNNKHMRSVNSNYGTIVKRKGTHSSRNPIRIEDTNLSTIESIDITDLSKSKEIDQTSLENDQQYEDIIDVQVIAKMQEETLRQSVLNINKADKKHLEYGQTHRGYNTNTIVKRTNHARPTLQTSNYDYESNQLRRDSASSSDRSSMSSATSNNGSPYASHVNVNVGFNNHQKPMKTNTAQSNKREINNYQTITKGTVSTQKMLNFAANSNMISTLTKSSLNSHSRSSTPSKSINPLTSSNSNLLKHDSRLPTPRGGQIGGSINKPPPSPLQVQANISSGRVGRAPMQYGGQRSATTSIVPMIQGNSVNTPNGQTNWQQSKFTKLQKQQQVLPKQPQHLVQQHQQQRSTGLSRTSTNQSISSSNSSNNIAPNTNPNSTISPSSSSSVSTSSSMHQIAPINSSSPRSRHTSPSLNSPYSQTNNTTTNTNKIVISPSGLLTDGPLGRRPLISPSPLRDRSSSPIYESKKLSVQQQTPVQLINQLNIGSNSSLHTIQESKIPTSSPMLNKKQQQLRKSFLPQPVHLQTQSVQNNHINQDSANWKDGCY